MKLNLSSRGGFTLSETMVSLSLSSVIFAATLTAMISLQKSFSAVDAYFSTHMQQIRIMDYLSRDVKRGVAVTTSVDLQTVTISTFSYLIEAGDPEAIADPSKIGTPRTPTITRVAGGPQVNYGAAMKSVVYSISGQAILRSENGQVTTIASSTGSTGAADHRRGTGQHRVRENHCDLPPDLCLRRPGSGPDRHHGFRHLLPA